jgi:hypothetical protein
MGGAGGFMLGGASQFGAIGGGGTDPLAGGFSAGGGLGAGGGAASAGDPYANI